MKFCLWLCGNKISKASEIKKNFDLPVLKGYLLGGILIKWLEENGGKTAAQKLKKIDLNGNVEAQLEKIFGVKDPRPMDYAPQFTQFFTYSFSKAVNTYGISSFPSSYSYEYEYEYRKSSFPVGSFEIGSFSTGSFEIGSFGVGSFEIGSFGVGSFSLGSFGVGSFNIGSFNMGSFSTGSFSVGSFTAGSFTAAPDGQYTFTKTQLTEEEYKETIFVLSTYPLNRYGYGIHLI
ncbi:MAG: pentapeptide repeat-containing protein [Ruminiclostridium sp.]